MKRLLLVSMVLLLVVIAVAACAQPTPQVVEKEVEVTVIVEKEVEKEVEVTVVVEKEVEKIVEQTVEVPVEVPVEVASKTLVFASTLFSVPREQEFFITEIIKPFEEEHGVSVNFQILAGDTLLDRAEVQQTTDHVTTDIVISHNGDMPIWLDNEWVDDLSAEVANWTDRTFMETFNQDTVRDGKQYFLPMAADVYLTLANNKALDYLPDGADMDSLTWEQYVAWAIAIAEGEGEGKVCITGIPSNSWIYQFGGEALSFGAGFPDANSPEALEAWKIWSEIGKAQGFIPGVLNVANCTDPMLREEAWLTVFHNARAGQVYASNETQYALGPAPTGPAGIGTIAGVSGYGVMKGAPNRELAIQFLEYVTRPDIQIKISRGTGGFIPPVQEAIDFLGDEAADEVIKKAILVLQNGIPSGVPGSLYTDWGAVKMCLDDVFEDTILAGQDVTQERADAAQACIDGLLR